MATVVPLGAMVKSYAGNGSAAWKYWSDGGRLLRLHHVNAPTASSTSEAAATSQGRRLVLVCAAALGEAPACEPDSAIQRNSAARSAALCQRSSGSLARHFRTTRSSAPGANGCSWLMGGGSAVRMAAIRLARLLPEKAGLPVAIS